MFRCEAIDVDFIFFIKLQTPIEANTEEEFLEKMKCFIPQDRIKLKEVEEFRHLSVNPEIARKISGKNVSEIYVKYSGTDESIWTYYSNP